MTGSISRKLYQHFLLLYPESFRQEFGNEMLDMFEDCKAAQGSWRLLADVIFSATKRQISHRSTSFEKRAPLYSEIAWSPKLARILAAGALGAALIAATLSFGGKPKAAESWTLLHARRRVQFPAALLQRPYSECRQLEP